MKRMLLWGFASLLVLWITGCGDESSHSPTEPVPTIVPGLSGDTYFNTKFGIKISNLPVNEWTVKALGNEGQGLRVKQEEIFRILMPLIRLYASYNLLLMEPVSDDQFVGVDESGLLDPVYEAGIPCISLFVIYEEGADFKTYDLADELDMYAALWSFEIESKKAIYVGNSTGLQAILSNAVIDMKQAVTWFAKGEVLVRCEYTTSSSDFYNHLGTYMELVENIWLMGK